MVELVEAVAMLAVTVGAVLAVLWMGVGSASAEIPPEAGEVRPTSWDGRPACPMCLSRQNHPNRARQRCRRTR